MKIIRKGRPIRKYTYVFYVMIVGAYLSLKRKNFRKSCAIDLFIDMEFITAPVLFAENPLCGVARK